MSGSVPIPGCLHSQIQVCATPFLRYSTLLSIFFFFFRERRHTLWWRIAERQVGFSELLSPAQKNHVSVHHENPATVDFSDGTPCHPRCDDLVLCQECENFGIKYQLILFIANSWPLRHPLANRAGRVAAPPKSVRRAET